MIEAGETLEIEFKGEERWVLGDADLVESVICLANRPGDEPGWLLVGVEDRLGPQQAPWLLNRLVGAGKLVRHGTRKGAWYGIRS